MSFVSYAQNFEDVMLWRALKDIDNGFYVDVGAAWPENDSVTKAFYDKGWSGINLEPNPGFFQLLQKDRARDINLNVAAGDKASKLELKVIEGTGLSTLDDTIAQAHEEKGWSASSVVVDVKPLSQIFDDTLEESQPIHFLKVDAEGFEEAVIKGNDWDRYRPWIVVVEATLPLSTEESYGSWERILLDAGYVLSYADGLNRFYLASEQSSLLDRFKYPPNVFDDFESAKLVESDKRLRAAKESIQALSGEMWDFRHKTNQLERKLAFLEEERSRELGIREHMEKSLSWRLTTPLRVLNPKRAVKPMVRAFASRLFKAPLLMYVLKPTLRKFPKLWMRLKDVLLFDNEVEGEPYEYLKLDGAVLAFAKGPLRDQRGIGRVTRELLAGLKAKSLPGEITEQDRDSAIHFFSSIHWCPDILPPKSIVMIHDVIPMIFPDIFPEVSRQWYSKYITIARQAKLIVTISQSSASDIEKYLGIPPNNIKVIYNGITNFDLVDSLSLQLPNKPYFVFFGSHDYHKNVDILLKAFTDLRLSKYMLVMIGDNQHCKKLAKELNIERQVLFLGRVADSEAAHIIKNSVALLFPSLYEGFGLPPFEAALLGTPSLCSDRPAMSELLRGAATFVDPFDSDAWATEMVRIGENPKLRESLSREAYAVASKFSWEESAKKLVDIFTAY